VQIDRPAPDGELNLDQPTVPRLAASVIVLRGGSEALEVLLVKRNPQAHFMGGAWVFPGGAVKPVDGAGEQGLKAAALRELREEASIELDGPAALVPFSNWITPAQVKTRFDTWFFLAAVPDTTQAIVDGAEVVDHGWYEPRAALEAAQRGDILLVFPTMRHLQQLSGFATADALIDHARGRDIRPVQPRVLISGEAARIVLPGELGYED
jgi:8-oxo-dGTP pyrophosphatase MutT (NUDIX family)